MTAYEQIMTFIDWKINDERINKTNGYLGKIELEHVWMRRDFFMRLLNESALNLERMDTDYKGRTHKFMGVPVDVRREYESTMPFNVVLIRT